MSEQEAFATVGDLIKGKLQGMDLDNDQDNITDYSNYKNNAYNVVSIFGYLIGVDKVLFEDDGNPAMLIDVYKRLDNNKNARIIRNLCVIRTALEKYYIPIAITMKTDIKNIDSMPEYIDQDAVWTLYDDGITLAKNHHDVDEYIIAINKEISNRINNAKEFFPEWLKFDYFKKLFLMPNGFTKDGIKKEGYFYNSNRNRYPYQVYMNWTMENEGNILYCDEKFVKLVYIYNEDMFTDVSLVRNAGNLAVEDINNFINAADKVIFVVDCENSNPVKLASVLGGLSDETKSRIADVLLFDSNYTTEGWQILSDKNQEDISDELMQPASAAVEENLFDWDSLGVTSGVNMTHIVVDRLLETKSQVDMTLAVKTTTEVYKNGVDSVVLVSSDSDYWAMISNLPDVKFMVMLEREKTSPKTKETLQFKGIHYCFLDDFYTGVSYSIKTDTLKKYIQRYFDRNLSFNARKLLDNAVYNSWIDMTEREKQTFMEKYIQKARIVIIDDEFRIVLGDR